MLSSYIHEYRALKHLLTSIIRFSYVHKIEKYIYTLSRKLQISCTKYILLRVIRVDSLFDDQQKSYIHGLLSIKPHQTIS